MSSSMEVLVFDPSLAKQKIDGLQSLSFCWLDQLIFFLLTGQAGSVGLNGQYTPLTLSSVPAGRIC